LSFSDRFWPPFWPRFRPHSRSRPRAQGSAGEQPVPAHGGRAAGTIAARLTFEGVERRYGTSLALAGLSLDIAPAEVVCLLGPSGCGKTTLLRVAAGIERPTAGRVLINDQEVAGPDRFVAPEKRNVGLMFQDFALFPHLTILANVAFGLRSLPREDARREALAVLARVGLERYANDYPHILSGGEQQRVALARAIVPRPAVMLMDEPFSGLDVQLRERLQEETIGLLRETRATCLIVTHAPA
jgi:iron(III) transport system ATP-binding protein